MKKGQANRRVQKTWGQVGCVSSDGPAATTTQNLLVLIMYEGEFS